MLPVTVSSVGHVSPTVTTTSASGHASGGTSQVPSGAGTVLHGPWYSTVRASPASRTVKFAVHPCRSIGVKSAGAKSTRSPASRQASRYTVRLCAYTLMDPGRLASGTSTSVALSVSYAELTTCRHWTVVPFVYTVRLRFPSRTALGPCVPRQASGASAPRTDSHTEPVPSGTPSEAQ